MQQRVEMATLSQVLERLKKKGFDNEIIMNDQKQMVGSKTNTIYQPDDLLIFKNFRFEGDSNPDDSSIILVVEDREGNIGYILDAYGAFSNHDGTEFDDFIKKIPTDEREDEELFS